MEKEESSHPRHSEHRLSKKQDPPHGRFARREWGKVHRLPSYRNFFERMKLGGDPQWGMLQGTQTCSRRLKLDPRAQAS